MTLTHGSEELCTHALMAEVVFVGWVVVLSGVVVRSRVVVVMEVVLVVAVTRVQITSLGDRVRNSYFAAGVSRPLLLHAARHCKIDRKRGILFPKCKKIE